MLGLISEVVSNSLFIITKENSIFEVSVKKQRSYSLEAMKIDVESFHPKNLTDGTIRPVVIDKLKKWVRLSKKFGEEFYN